MWWQLFTALGPGAPQAQMHCWGLWEAEEQRWCWVGLNSEDRSIGRCLQSNPSLPLLLCDMGLVMSGTFTVLCQCFQSPGHGLPF